MPNAALIAGKQTVIEGLESAYDAFSDTSHRLKTRTGTAPLESGSVITDHAVAAPIEVTLTGVVSDLHLNGDARPQEAWSALLKAWKEVNTFRVITPWIVYPEMLVMDVNARESGFGIDFEIKLQEIQLVGREEAVPSFEALAPAADRQPEETLGTIAEPPTPSVEEALEELETTEDLTEDRNALDWLEDMNDKADRLIGSVIDNDLVRDLREIDEILRAPIIRDVVDRSGLDSTLQNIDAFASRAGYSQFQRAEAIGGLKRARRFVDKKINRNNRKRIDNMSNYIGLNYQGPGEFGATA